MVELAEKIKALSGEIRQRYDFVKNKESTEIALILPFIKSLGYDVFDPSEVVPHYSIAVDHQQSVTVDYALLRDGHAEIIIECKHWGMNLDMERNSLRETFPLSQAKIAILTNGIIYRFFTDSETEHQLDKAPFFEFSILEVSDTAMETLDKFVKQNFDLANILTVAKEMKREKAKNAALNILIKRRKVSKKEIFVFLREDIAAPVSWSLLEYYRGITVASGYYNLRSLELVLFTRRCDLLIIDECHFDDMDAFCEFMYHIQYSNVSFKVLAIMSSTTDIEQVRQLLSQCDIVIDIIIRPFTIRRLYSYIEDAFGVKKSFDVGVKAITSEQLKRGLVAAENVYVPGKDEHLIECGVVLDDEHVRELIKFNISKIKVHKDVYKFINCWEFTKCKDFEDCPSFINVDADGFLDGVNAGRACMYINATLDMCGGGRKYKSWEEKIKVTCQNCEFYKMILTCNDGKIPPSIKLMAHMDKNIFKRKSMESARSSFVKKTKNQPKP
ncbi:two-CW domain-containing protein [Candidatus Magnetominusculus dajiuhuensis]|uniref:two-CW domain-containing protein n=1 Tax=Candidatus Magnetominusculus dajiuhuensis TaxID=3137712 RepID=UPI003B43B048